MADRTDIQALRELLIAYRDAAALRKALGAAVHAARLLRHRMRLDDLAAASGISKPYLSMIENGTCTPTTEKVKRLAAALDLDAAWMERVADLSSIPPSVLTLVRELAMAVPAAAAAAAAVESERAA